MAINQNNPTSYGFSQPLISVPNAPIISQLSPTIRDKTQLGTLWINQTNQNVYILTQIVDNQANWELLSTASGAMTNLTSDDSVLVTPIGGVIAILSGANITTSSGTHSVFVSLDDSVSLAGSLSVAGNISLPNTSSSTVGVIEFGSNPFITNKGTSNTFVGQNSGNVTLTGSNNSGFGYQSLMDLTTGSGNSGFGSNSLFTVTTGNNNIALGYEAGNSYTTESSNITIGNDGTVADANTLRIGTQGSGSGQINTAYIAGIYNSTIGSTSGVVQIDSTGKLGSSNGTDGQLLIGGGTAPVWATLTAGSGVGIVNNANEIIISSTGSPPGAVSFAANTGFATPTLAGQISLLGDGVSVSTSASGSTVTISATGETGLTLTSQSGVATASGSNIDVTGTSLINTSASGDTLDINLTNGITQQVISGGGSNASWKNLVAGTGVTIVTDSTNITISATGMTPVAIFEYTKTTTGGTAGVDLLAPQTYCSATGSIIQILAPNSGTNYTQVFDTGPYVNYTSSGVPFTVTALTTGIYSFTVNLYFTSMSSTPVQFFMYAQSFTSSPVGTANNFYSAVPFGATFPETLTATTQFSLIAGDTVQFSYFRTFSTPSHSWSGVLGAPQTSILGYMIS